MIGLDTNVLIRYIVRDDPAQAQAADGLIEGRCSRQTPGFVSHLVLVEIAWVLGQGYGYPREALSEVIAVLLTTEELVIEQPPVVRTALKAYVDTGADFADCLIGEVHLGLGCDATYTFDKKATRLPTHRLLK